MFEMWIWNTLRETLPFAPISLDITKDYIMKLTRLAPLLLIFTSIVGCKTTLMSGLNISQLINASDSPVRSALQIEVSSCKDYSDESMPSSDVLKLQHQIPKVFPDSEYLGCEREGMESFALFRNDAVLDRATDDEIAATDRMVFISKEGQKLSVMLPAEFLAKINDLKDRSGVKLDYGIMVMLKNDTDEPYTFVASGVYVDDVPYLGEEYTMEPGAQTTIVLGDVFTDAIIDGSHIAFLF